MWKKRQDPEIRKFFDDEVHERLLQTNRRGEKENHATLVAEGTTPFNIMKDEGVGRALSLLGTRVRQRTIAGEVFFYLDGSRKPSNSIDLCRAAGLSKERASYIPPLTKGPQK